LVICFSDDDDRHSVANGRREQQLDAPLYENAASMLVVSLLLVEDIVSYLKLKEREEAGWREAVPRKLMLLFSYLCSMKRAELGLLEVLGLVVGS
jgi:hypothetical protein